MARILIVDDNQTMAGMLSLVVELNGHVTRLAHSGQQALESIAEERPDVVLLDLMMPDMDGLETLRRLRAMPNGRDLPVIVVTARAELDLAQQIAYAGGDALLFKPVQSKELCAAIDAQLDRSRP